MNKEMMLLGTSDAPLDIPEGIDFEGFNNYLFREIGLVGNSNSKTVTLSFWSYYPTNAGGFRGIVGAGAEGAQSFFQAFMAGATTFSFLGRNASGSNVLSFNTVGSAGDFKLMPVRKWNNIIISFDLSDTLKRHVFINEIDVTNDITWATYVDDEIQFQQPKWGVGITPGSNNEAYKGRLCNMFLDYTYRDLTVASNRQLFVNSVDSGKRLAPASFNTMEALNPILFMPMKNGSTSTDNFGTGGNFSTFHPSFTTQRGPNQLNCRASVFDGANQGLDDSTGQGQQSFNFTMVANIFRNGSSQGGRIIQAKILATGQETHSLEITGANANNPGVLVFSASNVNGGFNSFINCTLPADDLFPPNTHNQVVISVTDPNPAGSFSTFHLFVNGVDKTSLVTRLGNGASFSRPGKYAIGQQDGGANKFKGTLGEVFFSSTRHWDLPNDNPFWDYENDLPRSLRDANAEDLRNGNGGIGGDIQCPIDASDPGKNNGNASDFTVETDSAGIAAMSGARGMSEYWAKSADFSNISRTFENTNNAGMGATKTLTYVTFFRHTSTLGVKALLTGLAQSDGSVVLAVTIESNLIRFTVTDVNVSPTVMILSLQKSCVIDQNTWHSLMVCVDMADVSKTKLYLDSVELTGGTHFVTDVNIDLSSCKWEVGGLLGSRNYPGNIGFVYFDDSYTDLTTRAGRNLFIDLLGFPVNVSKGIADGTISDPAMRFEFKNQALIGKNSGRGGDFSTNLMTQGADVYPNEF